MMLPSQSCTTKPLSILIGYSGFPCNNREHRSLMCNWEYGIWGEKESKFPWKICCASNVLGLGQQLVSNI